jgi:hypothetical protein
MKVLEMLLFGVRIQVDNYIHPAVRSAITSARNGTQEQLRIITSCTSSPQDFEAKEANLSRAELASELFSELSSAITLCSAMSHSLRE